MSVLVIFPLLTAFFPSGSGFLLDPHIIQTPPSISVLRQVSSHDINKLDMKNKQICVKVGGTEAAIHDARYDLGEGLTGT